VILVGFPQQREYSHYHYSSAVLRFELSAVEMFCVVLGDFSNDNPADCTPNNNPENLVCLGKFPSIVIDDVQICHPDVLRLQNQMCAARTLLSVDFESISGRMATRNVFAQSVPLVVVVASVTTDYFLPHILGALRGISKRYSVAG